MKRLIVLPLLLMVALNLVFAGIVTNTNQSAEFLRTMNRNASIDIDAVYFNPAGVMNLKNGFHAYFSNQSVFQKRIINADYSPLVLNRTEFIGDVTAPVFPNVYLAYKTCNWAFSLGLLPVGGGGGAEYKNGLPSFEYMVAQMVPLLASAGVTGYDFDVYFKGSSIYLAGQANFSVKINKMISFAAGVRYVNASNAYEGYVENIMINPQGNWMRAQTMFADYATNFANAAGSLQPLVAAGAGYLTLAQAQGAGYLTATQVAQLEGGLQQAGVDPTGFRIADVQGAYNQLAAGMNQLVAATGDKKLDAKRTGYGVGGIFSVHLNPVPDLHIGLRYESITKMTMTNETTENTSGIAEFDDGIEFHADMPALAAIGVSYKPIEKLKTEASFTYYFNNSEPKLNWDGREDLLQDSFDAGLGLEYCVTSQLLVGVGALYSTTAAKTEYLSDLDFSMGATSVGLGVKYMITPGIAVSLSGSHTFYDTVKNSTGAEEYTKEATVGAVGLQIGL